MSLYKADGLVSDHGEKYVLTQSFLDFLQNVSVAPDISYGPRPTKRQRRSSVSDLGDCIVVDSTLFTSMFESSILQNSRHPLYVSPATCGFLLTTAPNDEPCIEIYAERPSAKYKGLPIFTVLGLGTANDKLQAIDFAIKTSVDALSSNNPVGQGHVWTEISFEVGYKDGRDYISIVFTIKWSITESLAYTQVKPRDNPALQRVLERYYPEPRQDGPEFKHKWLPQDFYANVHVPQSEDGVADNIDVDGLQSELYPFQKRAVRWLLAREGVTEEHSVDGNLEQTQTVGTFEGPPLSFHLAYDETKRPIYISHLLRIVTRNPNAFRQMERLRGGILAEEMGLGKTVELISLILLHKREIFVNHELSVLDLDHEGIRSTKATLIITPPAILKQWMTEIRRHAPALKVMNYEGIGPHKARQQQLDVLNQMLSADIVLTTYNIVSSEIHYALPPPTRSLRVRGSYKPRYERPKSPLTNLLWWRVCLDEAQQVESGVSKAAIVAKLVPRINAWAVSGTPIRKDVTDLFGLLNFLCVEPFASSRPLWQSLITSHRRCFARLINHITLRHTKQAVRRELRLPEQQRYVLTIPFTAIEEQHYETLFLEMCEDCGVDRYGEPIVDDWDPDDPRVLEKMRNWLVRLRQTALHFEVGGRNRRALRSKDAPLRTIEQVLEVMLDQSELSIRTAQRARLVNKLRRGQLLENGPRRMEALQIWTQALEESTGIVSELRDQLEMEVRSRVEPVDFESSEMANPKDDIDPSSELSSRRGVIIARLRHALEVQHMALFFTASGHFQLRESLEANPECVDYLRHKSLEDQCYEKAKEARQEILGEIHQKTTTLMRKLSVKASTQDFTEIPELETVPPPGGIESRRIFDQLNQVGLALDAQANQIDEWREHTIQLLVRTLVDQDEGVEVTGDEYDESTKTEEEVAVYLQALRACIEDRHDALRGQENELVRVEIKTALINAKDLAKKATNGDEAAKAKFPEKTIALLKIREEIRPDPRISLRGVISDLRALKASLQSEADNGSTRAAAELSIIDVQSRHIQKQNSEQNKAVISLRQEVDEFTALMNSRLEYYRQLQQVSDMVRSYESANGMDRQLEADEKDELFRRLLQNEDHLQVKVDQANSKNRYLIHLKNQASSSAAERICIICQDAIEIGVLTVCGHQFCKICFSQWWHNSRKCPMCKRHLKQEELNDITYKPQVLQVETDSHTSVTNGESSRPKRTSIYNDMNQESLKQIQNIDLHGPSYATKIDTIARHVIWLRESDPGANSIIFSQFKEFLDIIGRAFNTFQIGHTRIDRAGGIEQFKNDPGIECFLLHAKAHSSGLNLIEASHVFLCEPLINTALELQAIARVHRIGQHQKTKVYLYLIADTIEEAIHEISVKRRMEHMGQSLTNGQINGHINGTSSTNGHTNGHRDKGKGKSKEDSPDSLDSNLEVANSLELQAASLTHLMTKNKAGGEVVPENDLWACLFGNARKKVVAQ